MFNALAQRFGIDERVSKYLLETEGVETLADFAAFFNTPEEVESKCISQITELERRPLQVARVRQAWEACRTAQGQAQQVAQAGTEATELDGLLSERELSAMRENFHRRYRLTFDAHVDPSDALVSRLHREIARRLCQVHDVARVKTLTHTYTATRKKQKLGSGMELLFPETEAYADEPHVSADTMHGYLSLLFTLMVAYARAGCNPTPFRAGRQEESIGADSCDYVEVPLDIVFKYHSRAAHRAAQIHPAVALSWIKERDVAERTMWTEVHRQSQKTLGAVIKEIYERREAQWDLPVQLPRGPNANQPYGPPPQPAAARPLGKHGSPKKTGTPPAGSAAGKAEVCLKFNRGKCPSKVCPQGRAHTCNKMLKSGRVCGMRNHNATTCRAK